jgi:hypothetical protein
MISHLAMDDRPASFGRVKRRPKGWTPERRARQAAVARRDHPWRHSTGPRTDGGKARVAMNALRHGYCSRAWLIKAQRIRRAIRLCAQTVLLVRLHLRERARPALQQVQRSSHFPPPRAGEVPSTLSCEAEGGTALNQSRVTAR